MSYNSAPPPSGGVNPYGEVPDEGASPSYGTPPPATSAPTDGPAYGTPPLSPPPAGTGYSQPPSQGYGQPGQSYGGPAATYSPYTAASRYPGAPGYGGWVTSSLDNGKGTGALVMGIFSIVLCFGSLLGVGLGIGAVIMGSQGRKAADAGTADNRGVATAGVILGSIGIAFSLLASLGYLTSVIRG